MSDLPARMDAAAAYLAGLSVAFDAINDPVGQYRAYHFVAMQHDTPPQQWAQTIRQMQCCYSNLRRSAIDRKRLLLDVDEIEERRCWTRRAKARQRLDLAEKALELENLDRGITAELRKLEAHEAARQRIEHDAGKPDGWTREEIEADQETYWVGEVGRLIRQSRWDVISKITGIGVGNLDALNQSSLGVEAGVKMVMAQIDATNALALEDSDG